MEQRAIRRAPEIRASGEGPTQVVGYAAVFYRENDPSTEYELWPGVIERVMPGAFDRALGEDDVRALFNHDPDNLLGRTKSGTTRLSVDTVGLRYEIDLDPKDPLHARVANMLERGDLDGSSFQFSTRTDTWRMDGGKEIRELRDVKLYDVGPVTFPAYEGASSGARSNDLAETRSSRDKWVASHSAEAAARDCQLRRVQLSLFEH